MKRRRILMGLCATAFALGLCFAGLEIATRVWYYVNIRNANRAFSALVIDDQLGWRPLPGFYRKGARTDAAGTQYPVEMRVDAQGFRRYRSDTPRGRLFVIGDSFTWAVDAGDADTYYAHLHRRLNLDVDAFGCGGYGTLQAAMVLEEHLDAIQPTAVLLQLCRNDFVNNRYDLEVRSIQNNNSMRRPYLGDDGEIVYAFPCGFPRNAPALRNFANRHSKFLYFIFSRIDRRLAGAVDSIEDRFARGEPDAVALYEKSFAVTTRILKRIRARVPADVPVLAFAVDDTGPFDAIFPALCAETGIRWLDDVAQAIARAEESGVVVRAADHSHWNPRGHALAADILAPALAAQLKPRAPHN